MARPREFDEEEVLDAALETFWTKGYEATSVQDLVDATGLARASLYGAFGDKHQLYQRVLERYQARIALETRGLEDEPSVRAGLERLFNSWLNVTCARSGPRGCFLLLAGTSGDVTDEKTLQAIHDGTRAMEKIVEKALRRGQASGELPADRDPAVLARLLFVLLQGLATAARQGWRRDRLEGVVSEALATTLGPAPGLSRR